MIYYCSTVSVKCRRGQARQVSLTSWGHSHVSTFPPLPGRCFSALELLNKSCLKFLFVSWQPEPAGIPNLGGSPVSVPVPDGAARCVWSSLHHDGHTARALGVGQCEFYRNCAQKGRCPCGFQLSQLQCLWQSDGTRCPQRLCPRTCVRLWP